MGTVSNSKIAFLRKRSDLIRTIRSFFFRRGYSEVETPLLSPYPCVEEHIDSLEVSLGSKEKKSPAYLISSPEYGMKRLLTEGIGDCFQICKVFRRGEFGDLHRPEFTMLEWYKVGADPEDLMQEISELFTEILNENSYEILTYAEAFRQFLALDCFSADLESIITHPKIPEEFAKAKTPDLQECLDYLFSFFIQPQLGKEKPTFVIDFPKEQAALAKLNPDGKTAARFEGFYRGVELCNGYHELSGENAVDDRLREINQKRKHLGKEVYPEDPDFLKAMRTGFPACSGVALGIDRLIMLALGAQKIEDVLPFG